MTYVADADDSDTQIFINEVGDSVISMLHRRRFRPIQPIQQLVRPKRSKFKFTICMNFFDVC